MDFSQSQSSVVEPSLGKQDHHQSTATPSAQKTRGKLQRASKAGEGVPAARVPPGKKPQIPVCSAQASEATATDSSIC